MSDDGRVDHSFLTRTEWDWIGPLSIIAPSLARHLDHQRPAIDDISSDYIDAVYCFRILGFTDIDTTPERIHEQKSIQFTRGRLRQGLSLLADAWSRLTGDRLHRYSFNPSEEATS